MMWRCLIKKNIKISQVSNIGCKSKHRPIIAHKLEEKYVREYKDMIREQWLQLDMMHQFQGYSQLFSGSFILCSAVRKSSIVNGFHLDRLVPFLVNISDLLRNLLRVAISCFVPRISGIYIELKTLWKIWQQFSYQEYISMIYLCICISSPPEQDMLSEGTADWQQSLKQL